ncbi:MAG: mechanosensitive ion channel [Alphaproteobacteria bacterium]|nr:mechanosensitive ion channel [Alphaproteobacteria bacterium]
MLTENITVAEKVQIEAGSLEAILSTLGEKAISFGLRFLAALLILGIGLWLSKRLLNSIRRGMERRKVELSLRTFLLSFLNIVFKAFVVIICLTTVGVQMTSIVAVLGAASLAVGMALSGTLQNFAGGIVILFFKPFKVGDTIETATGKTGVVKKIMIFTTELHTFDNQVIFLPNGALSNGEITNLSKGTIRRSDLKLSIAYGDSVDQARKVILGILKKDKRVMQDPAPLVFVNSLGDSGVELIVRYWSKYVDVYGSTMDLIEQIYETLPTKSINFPFPQMDVRIVKE